MAPTVTYGLAEHPDPDDVYDAVRVCTNGHEISIDRGGEPYSTSDPAEIRVLDEHPAVVRVAEAIPAESNLSRLTRAQLDEEAAAAGVDPSVFKTKGELVAALEALAGASA